MNHERKGEVTKNNSKADDKARQWKEHVILLQGAQALLACPSDNGIIKLVVLKPTF
jgi:hypothetical protein